MRGVRQLPRVRTTTACLALVSLIVCVVEVCDDRCLAFTTRCERGASCDHIAWPLNEQRNTVALVSRCPIVPRVAFHTDVVLVCRFYPRCSPLAYSRSLGGRGSTTN